ncbi:MAG TPA: hypothetical protein VJ826_01370, partial [Candidatus Polarisedimenticolaceae bacterium]|nr:hypothetical protein [Candidatus Polarisedimenticolaceae bacterium]
MRRVAALVITLWAASSFVHAQPACEPCAQARALRAGGKSKEAAALLKKAGKELKDSAELQGLLLECALDLGRSPEAGAALPKFLAAQPTPEQLVQIRESVAQSVAPAPSRGVEIKSPDGAQPPILVSWSRASYPHDSSEFAIGASVVVDATIAVDGTIKRAEARADQNWADSQVQWMQGNAVSALMRWRFFPALLDGH